MTNSFIIPNWNAPKHIKSAITSRKYLQGVSKSPFDQFNLAIHVEDHLNDVQTNRNLLCSEFHLEHQPIWLNQIHSTTAIELEFSHLNQIDQIQADASYTHQHHLACAVMTADCLPLLVTDIEGRAVGAIHAGWRGLLKGIIEETIMQMSSKYNIYSNEFLVYLGPAISQKHFEVGQEVYDFFKQKNQLFEKAFIPAMAMNKYFADIYELARLHLECLGISQNQIFGGNFCTVEQHDLFYSYRKENKTGRMASLIWIDA